MPVIRTENRGLNLVIARAFTAIEIMGLERSPKFFRPSSLDMVEEPEDGWHVNEFRLLLARIVHSGNTGQFIFASHSPYFMDLFDNHLDGIQLMKAGSASFEIARPDPAKIQPLLEDMPLGELLLPQHGKLARTKHLTGNIDPSSSLIWFLPSY